MPVLLLAQGEPAAKDMLRQAIEARYGARPPALDSLCLGFTGRARVRFGPVNTWVPVEATAYFRFPDALRWDFVVKPMKMPVQRGVEAFDGETCRTVRGGKTPMVIDDPAQIRSMRSRLWAVAAILLTPLSDLFVTLKVAGNYSFEATNTKLNDTATISLRGNNKLDQVKVHCLNTETHKQQDYVITLSDELVTLNELLLPARFSIAWDDVEALELEPTHAESNPVIPDAVFRLEAQVQ